MELHRKGRALVFERCEGWGIKDYSEEEWVGDGKNSRIDICSRLSSIGQKVQRAREHKICANCR